MGEYPSNEWARQAEQLRAEGLATAAVATILREKGASQREVASALGIGRTTARRLLGEPGAERPASNGSGGVAPTSNGSGPVEPVKPPPQPLTTAAGLIVDELERAAQFRARGEFEKAAILIDRTQVRGASAEQVHAALSAPFVAPVKDDITVESSATEANTRRTQIVGIALALGLLALGLLAWKIHQARTAALTELEPATDPAEIDAEALVAEVASQLGDTVPGEG